EGVLDDSELITKMGNRAEDFVGICETYGGPHLRRAGGEPDAIAATRPELGRRAAGVAQGSGERRRHDLRQMAQHGHPAVVFHGLDHLDPAADASPERTDPGEYVRWRLRCRAQVDPLADEQP